MRAFLGLVHREWRDARAPTLVSLPLVVILSLATNEMLDYTAPKITAQFLVPALAAMYAAMIASDLVAGDTASGRAGTFSLLPVRPLYLWFAKVIWLLGASFGYLLFVIAVQVGLSAWRGPAGGVQPFLEALLDSARLLAMLVPFATAVMLGSTVLRGGFTAVGCGVASLVPLFVLEGIAMHLDRLGLGLLGTDDKWAALALCTAAWLGGSAVAYARGIGGGRRGWRPVALGLGVAVALPLLAAGAVLARMHLRANVALDDLGARINWITTAPDARHIAVELVRRDASGNVDGHRVVVLCVDDGVCVALPWWQLTVWPVWSGAGELRTRGIWTEIWTELGIDVATDIYDPDTGVTREAPPPQARESWARIRGVGEKQGVPSKFEVLWVERNETFLVECDAVGARWPRATGIPGVVVRWSDASTMTWHDLSRGEERVLGTPDVARDLWTFGPGERRMLAVLGGRFRVIDLATGEDLVPPLDPGHDARWAGRRGDDRYVWINDKHGDGAWILDLDSGDRLPVYGPGHEHEPDSTYWSDCDVLGDGRLVQAREGKTAIDVIGRDGRIERRLLKLGDGAR